MIVIRLPARFPLQFLLALAAGALHALSFVDEMAWPLELLSLAAFFALLHEADRWRAAARWGFAFGLGWFGVGFSWVYVSMHEYGLMSVPLAGGATLLFCALMALYPAAASGLAVALAQRFSGAGRLLCFLPPLWCVADMLRGWLFTGFPWIATGYAHVGGPLAGLAPVVGVYGVGLAAASIAAALSYLARRRAGVGLRSRALALALLLGLPIAGQLARGIEWSHADGPAFSVRLLQGNIPQDVKFDPSRFAGTVDTYFGLIEAKRADLIVLPETALPRFFDELPPEVLERIGRDSTEESAVIAMGVPIADGPEHYTNSVLAFSPGSTHLQRYDKSHLVPFGEFVPLGFHWFVRMLQIPLGDFSRGTTDPTPMTLVGRKIAFDICYEDLFGEEIIRSAASASVLVNVSNVAWFGDSMALPQHLAIARMRALETARPMLRATNTGMTASIDPHGVVKAVLAPLTAGALDTSVAPMTGDTPYLRLGNAPDWGLCALILILALFGKRRSDPATR